MAAITKQATDTTVERGRKPPHLNEPMKPYSSDAENLVLEPANRVMMPMKADELPRVATKGLMWKKLTSAPFTTPHTRPTAMATTIATPTGATPSNER
ncbi:unannotated protein [freshwater metagenome]|uniref:Unannotated protein n=1 Tax=freshwater metagenome TaxID=449393 RepID=A0A6J7BYB0_9ZZZZ